MPLKKVKRVIYNKNALDRVICQLRFPPILKIDSEVPANFQERIREMFPFYNEKVEIIREFPSRIGEGISPEAFPNIRRTETHKIHLFASADKIWNLNLTRTFFSLTTSKYTRWEEFIEKLNNPMQAFLDIYKPPFFTRIGLRYVDIFDRAKFGLKDLNWNELLNPYFLGLLSSPISDDVRNCESKYEITLEDKNGILRIITSFIDNLASAERCYLVDSDFYYPNRVDIKDYSTKLEFLHDQAGRLIQFIITPKLHNAMEPIDL